MTVTDTPLLDTDSTTTQQDVPAAEASPDGGGLVAVIERLAANPQVDVEKLERIIALQERILRHNAKAAFDGAYARMQADMPEIDEKGKILVKGQLRSTYARLEDIHAAIRPVLKEYGFAMRHRTEWPADKPGIIRIVGILSHEQGHSEESCFEATADASDFRTDIQSQGSTVSYGRRYSTLDLLNIATRGQDNDGRTSGRPAPPDNYDEQWTTLAAQADHGTAALERAWQCMPVEFKQYTVNHNRSTWNEVKALAAKVKT